MATSLEGLHPVVMRPRVEALLADPDARALGVHVVSAFRSIARQAALFAAAVVRYGSVARARRWVAPPGKSNHGPRRDGFGTAVDLGLPGVKAVSGQWPDHLKNAIDAVAARHGLYSPMAWEDWHFEPIAGWTPALSEEDDMTPELRQYLDEMRAEVLGEIDKVQEAVAGRVPGKPKERSLIGRIGDALKVKP